MALPDVVSREQWLEARRQLLAREKEDTRSRDALNADRRRLPMVRVDQEYVFEGPDGTVTLAGLFGDSRQLIVQHVMVGPGLAHVLGLGAGHGHHRQRLLAARPDGARLAGRLGGAQGPGAAPTRRRPDVHRLMRSGEFAELARRLPIRAARP